MNWRLATSINALIALVTITAVIYGASQLRHWDSQHKTKTAEVTPANSSAPRRSIATGMSDITEVRVDKLASVPSPELHEVLWGATPEQIRTLALKFNDLPSDAPTLGAVGVFFKAWTEIDGKAALQGAFQLKNLTLKRTAAAAVVGSISPSACAEIANYLRDHPDIDLLQECRGEYLDPVLERWALVDAAAAAKFFDNLGDGQHALFYETDNKIGRAWATVDPYKALAWADKHTYPTSNDQDVLFSETIAGWSTTDMPAAANYVAQHMDRQGAKEAADAIVAAMLNQDGNGGRAVKWLSNLPSSLRKKEVQGNFACVWAKQNPEASAHWVETLPAGEQPAAVGGLMVVWAGDNWSAASKWIDSVSGELRDQAINSAINCCGLPENIPPAQAMSLALSVRDPELRFDTLKYALSHWAMENREAAVAWVKRSSLSEKQKRAVLSLDMLSPQKSEEDSTANEVSD
jgi:hypothetical protein